MRVGFIGLGSQGGPMARQIIDAEYHTTLWARRPEKLEPYADTAAKVAGSPAELGAASDVVCLCVVGDADVAEVTGGENGGGARDRDPLGSVVETVDLLGELVAASEPPPAPAPSPEPATST